MTTEEEAIAGPAATVPGLKCVMLTPKLRVFVSTSGDDQRSYDIKVDGVVYFEVSR